MLQITTELIGDEAVLSNIDKCRDAYDKAMDMCAKDLKDRIQKEIKKNDTGRLHSPESWLIKQGDEKFSRVIYTTVAYAEYVHEGTGPAAGHEQYWPNMSALEPWCRNHGIDNVFLVARKIYRYGTTPDPFADRAIDSVGDAYSKFLDKALVEAGVVL